MTKEEIIKKALEFPELQSLLNLYVVNCVGHNEPKDSAWSKDIKAALEAYARSAMEAVVTLDMPAPSGTTRGEWLQSWLDATTEVMFAHGVEDHYKSAAEAFSKRHTTRLSLDLVMYTFGRLCQTSCTIVTTVRFGLDPHILING